MSKALVLTIEEKAFLRLFGAAEHLRKMTSNIANIESALPSITNMPAPSIESIACEPLRSSFTFPSSADASLHSAGLPQPCVISLDTSLLPISEEKIESPLAQIQCVVPLIEFEPMREQGSAVVVSSGFSLIPHVDLNPLPDDMKKAEKMEKCGALKLSGSRSPGLPKRSARTRALPEGSRRIDFDFASLFKKQSAKKEA